MWRIGPAVRWATAGLVGVLDLAEDLTLAQHQALQAGGHPEQMPDRPLVVVADQMRREALGRQGVEAGEEGRQSFGLERPLGVAGGVDLHPVAGREHRELTAGESPRQRRQALGPFVAVERQRLADRGRCRAVIDPQRQQLHSALPPPAATAPARRAPWASGARRPPPR